MPLIKCGQPARSILFTANVIANTQGLHYSSISTEEETGAEDSQEM